MTNELANRVEAASGADRELRRQLRAMGAEPVEQSYADFRASVRLIRRRQIGMAALRARQEKTNG